MSAVSSCCNAMGRTDVNLPQERSLALRCLSQMSILQPCSSSRSHSEVAAMPKMMRESGEHKNPPEREEAVDTCDGEEEG